MNIQAEKMEIMKMIIETDNSSIIHSIKNLFIKESEIDFWKTLKHEEKKEIQKGINEIKSLDFSFSFDGVNEVVETYTVSILYGT
ncbi:MAG: hypothetical protein PF445_05240, partial [Melioribacteraceae bacterium]|nr:hypothetical protein [Melioribacteraceae bacterium]